MGSENDTRYLAYGGELMVMRLDGEVVLIV